MNRDQVKGKVTEVKGTVKRKLGETLGDRELESEGLADETGGAVRKTYGDVKETVKDAAKKTVGEARREWRKARNEVEEPAGRKRV